MSLREHILNSFARPYIPVGNTMIYHFLLPFRPFLALPGSHLTLTDHFHYCKRKLTVMSLLDKVNHNIISCTYSCRNCCFSLFNKSLCISKPYIGTMCKSCNSYQIREILRFSIHKHLHGKICTKFRNTERSKFTAAYILRFNSKCRCILKQ